MNKRLLFWPLLGLIPFSCSYRVNKEGNPVSAIAPCNTPQRITAIYPEHVYDLSGYTTNGGGNPFNLFDENAFVDPKGKNDFHPVTNPHPLMTGALYFPPGRGSRIVVDLGIPYKLSEVYLYDMARQADSVWIYTGTMKNWKLKAALSTRGDISAWGWHQFSVTDTTRYLMFRFRSWEATITEAVLYGCPLAPIPPPPAPEYTGQRLPKKNLRQFLGVNTYQTVPLEYMKPFYNVRLYTTADQIDRDTVNAYPNQLFNLSAQGWWNGGVQDYTFFADSISRYAGGRIWYSVLGVPRWMQKQGFDDRDRPVTLPGMNPEDPASYKRHASMFWNLAALYGNTAVDTNLIQVANRPRFSGRGVMQLYENGNEVDANWVASKYCNPVEYFAQSSADFDGHEGTLGPRLGLVKADPNSKLMMSGMVGTDTNRLRVLDFLCRTLRTDQQFIWKGGIQYHHYSTDGNGKGRFPGEGFAYTTRGTSPEEDSLRIRMTRVREYTYRIAPEVECILGEYGYDKSRKSKMAVPLVKGYNARQSQGIMLLRAINAVAFAGMDRMILYWIKDDYGEDQEAFFLSSGLIKQSGNSYQPYESWYYISTLVNQLGDYIPEKIVAEKGPVWVYQYRHQTKPDSIAYFLYCPSYNGAAIENYSLKVGSGISGTVTELQWQDGSVSGKSTALPVRNGAVQVKVAEMPRLIFVNTRK